ncbi:TonB-dependent receptor domain-containing protein [Sphingomonas gilva]|nr:TonB-dependent receptor [Sphingomonas gilva]
MMKGLCTPRRRTRRALALTTAALMCGASGTALAQDAAQPAAGVNAPPQDIAEPTPEETTAEDIIVTGSRIRGVAPVGSSVITLGSESLEKTPATNVVDLLRRVPQVSGAGINESVSGVVGPGVSSSNATRTGAINLRGVGPKATLVLFGGQRLATSGLNGAQTDPASIPSSVLERVEVVADGASAIYGSDAVAGVVNFIPRTRYDGLVARARLSEADDYSQRQLSIMGGVDWDNGGLIVAFQHDYNSRLRGVDRDYYRSDLTDRGGDDYRSQQCNPGNIIVDGIPYAIPEGGVTSANADQLVPNTRNLCEVYRLGDILGQQERNAGYASITQELTPGLSVFARGFYAERRFDANDTQQGSTSSVANLTVPSTNPYFVAPPGTDPSSVVVQYFFGADAPLAFSGLSKSHLATIGADLELGGTWKVSTTANWAHSSDVVNAFFALPAALTAALNSTDPATAFNPFGGGNSQAVRDAVFSSYFNSRPRSRIFSSQAELSGTLFDISGGAVRLAAGFDYTRMHFRGESNRGTQAAPVTTVAQNQRSIHSGYAELYVPLFGSANATPGFERLELSLAGRYDDYSDVGGTFNPKFGVNWSPVRDLTFKGSYGTSFKAPYLSDTLSPKSGAALVVTTQPDPSSPTGSSTGLQINDGNPGLSPEEATTWTIGAEWRPTSDLTLTATYFNLDYTGQITAPAINTVLVNPLFAGTVIRNPTQQQVDDLIANSGLRINGVLPAQVDFIFDGRPSNLSATQAAGFDFVLSYDKRLDWGDIYASVGGTLVTQYDIKVTDAAPAQNVLNTIYYPPRFRFNADAGWSNAGWAASATLRFLNGYTNNLVTPDEKIDANATLDLRVGYEFEQGSPWLEGLGVSLEVTNVFDTDPPFVNIQGGVDASAASLFGRMFTLVLEKKF